MDPEGSNENFNGKGRVTVHHYAPCAYVPRILDSGELRPSNAEALGEKPLLWFSANQKWEPTATKFIGDAEGNRRSLTLSEQLQRFGCCRFSLPANDLRLIPWIKACRIAGTSYTKQRKMEAVGRIQGANSFDWFAISESISVAELAFSVFDGRTWKTADLAETAKVWA